MTVTKTPSLLAQFPPMSASQSSLVRSAWATGAARLVHQEGLGRRRGSGDHGQRFRAAAVAAGAGGSGARGGGGS